MANLGDFSGPAFPASRMQHISDPHSKFALWPPCVKVWQTPKFQSATAEIRRGIKKEEPDMWANARRDGRPAEHRWRPLFNAAKFG